MRHFITLILLAAIGCRQPEPEPEPSPVVVEAPKPRPPRVDDSFSTPAQIAQWQAETIAIIDEFSQAPHPRQVLAYASQFSVDPQQPDPLVGSPDIWDPTWSAYEPGDYGLEAQHPSLDEARQLEAEDREWEAAQIYLAHGQNFDAARCAKALEDEKEWKVVALIAVQTGDLEQLSRATDQLMGADQVSKTQDILREAISSDKANAARHIANRYDWTLEQVLSAYEIRQLALAGDSQALEGLIQEHLRIWESTDFRDDNPATEVVTEIAILARTNPSKAESYAARYLRLPQANVLFWTHCGEGCYMQPVRGSIEFYQLIRDNVELRELYFTRIQGWFAQSFPKPDGVVDREATRNPTPMMGASQMEGFGQGMWGHDLMEPLSTNLLYSHLWHVRHLRDTELLSFWVGVLDDLTRRTDFDGETLCFEREFGRYVLGLPFGAQPEGCNGSEQIALGILQGRPLPDMEPVWNLWTLTAPTRDEFDQLNWLFAFLTRGSVSPEREGQIRAELLLPTTSSEFDVTLADELRMQFSRGMLANFGDLDYLDNRFDWPQKAYMVNVEARRIREERGLPPVELMPDTPEELEAITAPVTQHFQAKLPFQYTRWTQNRRTP